MSHSQPLRVGLVLPTRQGPSSRPEDAARAVALALRAEALGFDAVWAGESILARPRFDAITLLAAVAACTERVRIGTGVLLPALHPPLVLAQRLATLDALSEGRLVVGAGIGIDTPDTRREFHALGVPFEERVGRLVATVQLLRSWWRADGRPDDPARVTKYWDLADVEVYPKPFRPGGPPLWVGSTLAVEAALARAGREFDGWLPTCPSPEAYAEGWRRVTAAADAADRAAAALTPAVYLTVCVAESRDEALPRLGRYLEAYYRMPYDVMSRVQGVFAGTPEACAAWIQRYVDAGVREIVLRSPDPAADVETLARAVLPRLARAA